MGRYGSKIDAKLYELGKMIGLETSEIDHAKRTVKTLLSMYIVAGIVILIGITSNNLNPGPLWYGAISVNDFISY